MRLLRWIFLGVVIAACWGTAAGATTPPTEPAGPPATDAAPVTEAAPTVDTVVPELEVPPAIVDPQVVSGPLVVAPPGCNVPPAPVAVFIGTLAAADATTGRFAVEQIRAGTLDGYAVETIVDVRYNDDIRFLRPGQEYLVGVAPDPIRGGLRSKVRLPAPLFGGDAVIGINDTDLRCPRFEDGVKTLRPDGTEVDTGVLAPLKTAKQSLLKAVLKPLVIAVAVLVVLVAIKLLIFAMVRTVREAAFDDVPPPLEVERDRQHIDDGDGVDQSQGVADGDGSDDDHPSDTWVTSPRQ